MPAETSTLQAAQTQLIILLRQTLSRRNPRKAIFWGRRSILGARGRAPMSNSSVIGFRHSHLRPTGIYETHSRSSDKRSLVRLCDGSRMVVLIGLFGRFQILLGLVRGRFHIRLHGLAVETRPEVFDGAAEGRRIRPGYLGLQLIERDSQIVGDVNGGHKLSQ